MATKEDANKADGCDVGAAIDGVLSEMGLETELRRLRDEGQAGFFQGAERYGRIGMPPITSGLTLLSTRDGSHET